MKQNKLKEKYVSMTEKDTAKKEIIVSLPMHKKFALTIWKVGYAQEITVEKDILAPADTFQETFAEEEIPVDTCMRKRLVWKSVITVINLSRILIIVNFAVKVFVQVVQFKKQIIETCTIKKNISNSVQASTKREQAWLTYELGCAPLLVFLFLGLLWSGDAVEVCWGQRNVVLSHFRLSH